MSSKAKYEPGEDGLPRAVVGEWAEEKIERLCYYVNITRKARRKWLRTVYIELFAGPGQCRISGTKRVIDGTALAAYKQSVSGGVPFSHVIVGDARENLASACKTRLEGEGANVTVEVGRADETVVRIAAQARKFDLGLCLLDPFAISPLPFSVLETLTQHPRLDLLVHVSLFDLVRNIRSYVGREGGPLDAFAPGWREHVDIAARDDILMHGVIAHWKRLLEARGKTCSEPAGLIRGHSNAPYYWLMMVAGHATAHELWAKVYIGSRMKDLFQPR